MGIRPTIIFGISISISIIIQITSWWRIGEGHPEVDRALLPPVEKSVKVVRNAAKQRTRMKEIVSRASMNIKDLDENLFGCLSHECIERLASQMARVYPKLPDRTWCVKIRRQNNVWRGILLVKMPKVASSTTAAVAHRLAHRFHCNALQWQHTHPQKYRNRRPGTLLFTSVRDPGSRSVSRLYFSYVSRMEWLRSNSSKVERMLLKELPTNRQYQFGSTSAGQGGFQLNYASMEEIPHYSAWNESSPTTVINAENVVRNVWNTFSQYTLILIPELMDESLVALALLLDIDVSNVLVQSSKVSGSYYYRPAEPPHQWEPGTGKCIPLHKTVVSERVEEYLRSDEWRALNYGDYLLHELARQALQRTVEALQPEFDIAMQRYQRLKGLAAEECANRTIAPCSPTGVPQLERAQDSCYKRDLGCGYKCIDELIKWEQANDKQGRKRRKV